MPSPFKLPPLPDLTTLVNTKQIEETRTAIEKFVALHVRAPDIRQMRLEELVKEMSDLLTKFGKPAEVALYSIICEGGELRTLVDQVVSEGIRSALGFIVPLLVAQFALTPAVALIIATFIVKTFAIKAQEKLCVELTRRRIAVG